MPILLSQFSRSHKLLGRNTKTTYEVICIIDLIPLYVDVGERSSNTTHHTLKPERNVQWRKRPNVVLQWMIAEWGARRFSASIEIESGTISLRLDQVSQHNLIKAKFMLQHPSQTLTHNYDWKFVNRTVSPQPSVVMLSFYQTILPMVPVRYNVLSRHIPYWSHEKVSVREKLCLER